MASVKIESARVHVSWAAPDGYRSVQWNGAEVVIRPFPPSPNRGDTVTIELLEPQLLPNAPTDEARLALAILDGEADAVWPLIDDILSRRDAPTGFVPRGKMLALLRQILAANVDNLGWRHYRDEVKRLAAEALGGKGDEGGS